MPAIIALLVASGGAFAAGKLKIIISSTKQISPKVLKELKGTAGPAGPTGPVGPAGTPGTAGKDGAQGVEGKEGKEGREGKQGIQGVEGNIKATLPSGITETGTWATVMGKLNCFGAVTCGISPLSFSIPLEAPIAESNIQINGAGYDGTDGVGSEHEACPGTAQAPKAKPAFLCIYTVANHATGSNPSVPSNTTAGAVLLLTAAEESDEGKFAMGTWAVTAE